MNKGEVSFDDISNEIINNYKYKKLLNEDHHGLSRYEHSIRVAKITYKLSKKLKIDYVSATRAALLHDFFENEDLNETNSYQRSKLHPKVAALNSAKYFKLNNLEKNAIESHMFPLNLKIPNTKEGIVLNVADKSVALYELTRYKLNMTLGVYILFLFNILTFTNN